MSTLFISLQSLSTFLKRLLCRSLQHNIDSLDCGRCSSFKICHSIFALSASVSFETKASASLTEGHTHRSGPWVCCFCQTMVQSIFYDSIRVSQKFSKHKARTTIWRDFWRTVWCDDTWFGWSQKQAKYCTWHMLIQTEACVDCQPTSVFAFWAKQHLDRPWGALSRLENIFMAG